MDKHQPDSDKVHGIECSIPKYTENDVKGNLARNSVTRLAEGMLSQFHNTIMSVRVGLKNLSLGFTVCHQ